MWNVGLFAKSIQYQLRQVCVRGDRNNVALLLLFQLNPSVNLFQRKFVTEIKRCEEMERILGKDKTGWFVPNLKAGVKVQVISYGTGLPMCVRALQFFL